MNWCKYMCCWKTTDRPRSKGRTLPNIVNRRYAEQNEYSILKPTMNRSHEDEEFHNVRYFRTNCNFIGVDPTELTFVTGDVIEVDEAYEHRYLHRARHVRNGLVGYVSKALLEDVPIVELQPWYFHNITRPVARYLLLNSPRVGTFLVRKSSSKGQAYSLSIRSEDNGKPTVMHYQIRSNINGYYISEGCHVKYLDGLIKLYTDDIHGYLRLNPRLRTPCVREEHFRIPLSELDTLL